MSREERPMGLRDHRLNRLLSIRELAKAADVSPQTIVSIEGGHRPHYETMRKLCAALNVEALAIQEFAAVIEERRR